VTPRDSQSPAYFAVLAPLACLGLLIYWLVR